MSRLPNERALMRGFGQYELVTEGEERHTLWGQDGKLKLLVYANRGRMGSYDDAISLALATHAVPATELVRIGSGACRNGAQVEQRRLATILAFSRALA